MFAADCTAQKVEAQGTQLQVIVGYVKRKDSNTKQEDTNVGPDVTYGQVVGCLFFFFLS